SLAPEVRAAASAPKPAASKPEAAKAETKPGADPLGDLAVAKAAAKGNVDPFDYFVQAGAFRTQADADAQRAKLAMMGWEARVSEREQNGRAVFRVRVGPFTKRDDAEQLKEKLDGAGLESALVRVQR
ncbi:SPOR domain-containing protein, partial [Acidovorax sp. HMWF029]|uniref:SPOR domain-containing protein n=1 Tax=Acidovorax sp. HMWF029 TaxID=2056863 RepID=UPI001E583475